MRNECHSVVTNIVYFWTSVSSILPMSCSSSAFVYWAVETCRCSRLRKLNKCSLASSWRGLTSYSWIGLASQNLGFDLLRTTGVATHQHLVNDSLLDTARELSTLQSFKREPSNSRPSWRKEHSVRTPIFRSHEAIPTPQCSPAENLRNLQYYTTSHTSSVVIALRKHADR